MLLTDIGSHGGQVAQASANFTFTPLFDRAAFVKDIRITNVSATDSWTVSVGGRELMRFNINTNGNNQVLGTVAGNPGRNKSWFKQISLMLGRDIGIPVPQGQTITIASVGAATGDIEIVYEERTPSDMSAMQPNHYQGNEFYLPVFFSRAAAINAIGVVPYDTQVAAAWLPNIVVGNPLPVAWQIDVMAMWNEAASVNTFSGAANHVSETEAVQAVLDGQLMWTRNNTGIGNLSKAAAAGSANTVFTGTARRYDPFQINDDDNMNMFSQALQLRGGMNFALNGVYLGDVTGGASYVNAINVLLAHVIVPG